MTRDPGPEGTPSVLVVDDDPDLRDLYSEFLSPEAEVTTAPDGEAALAAVSDNVDVVFLDRNMPGLSGDEVLERIRATDHDCYVAMLTGADPDLDVFDMEFDEYVQKPVTAAELRDTLTQLLQRSAFDEEMRNLFAKTSKRNVVSDSDSLGDAWSKEEISAIVEDADVAPAPGVFGGWHDGRTAIREEREREFTAGIDRHAIPVLLEQVTTDRDDAPIQHTRRSDGATSVRTPLGDRTGNRRTISGAGLREITRRLAIGFEELGVTPGAPVVLASGPRLEAAWTDFGILAAGGAVVGLDRSADPTVLADHLDRATPVGVVVEDVATVERWDHAIAESSVEFVVVFEEVDRPEQYRCRVLDLGSLSDMAGAGTEASVGPLLDRLTPTDTAGLVVVEDGPILTLTHRNLLENAAQLYARLAGGVEEAVAVSAGAEVLTALDPTDPFGRVVNHFLPLLFGGVTAYPASPDRLRTAARRDRPTVIAASSGVAEQFIDRVTAEAYAETTIATWWSIEWGTRLASRHRSGTASGRLDRLLALLADRFGLSAIRGEAGNPAAVLYGSGPLGDPAHRRLIGAGIVPVRCWAPARAGVVVSVTPPDDPRQGSLGIPLYDQDIDVKWTPATQAAETRAEVGELAIAGPNVPESVQGTGSGPFDEAGRLKTGVLVEWDQEDFLWSRS